MSNSPPKLENDEENDLFYFESDHLALRGNKDYSELLKTMCILQAQRQQAIQDFNKVTALQNECLEDPLEFVEKLKNGTFKEQVPELIKLPDIPKINWSKYNVKIADCYLKEINSDTPIDCTEVSNDNIKINTQSWSIEEQRKLEELLIKYPPESLESKRIKKIAAELGSRTPKQICSRLQKYFLKLQKAGIPVPGQPRKTMTDYRLNKRNKQKYRQQFNMMRRTTFFPDLDIPVTMNENEEVPGPSNSSQIPSEPGSSNSSNYLLGNNYHNDKNDLPKSNVDIQLIMLRKIKIEKENIDDQPFRHVGYRCDYCDEDPIIGSRWHCSTCSDDSIDFCTDCMLTQLYSDKPHSIKHRFIIIKDDKTATNCIESDSESMTGSCDDSSIKNEESNYDSSEQFSEDETSEQESSTPINNVSIKDENEDCEMETYEINEESNHQIDNNHVIDDNITIKEENVIIKEDGLNIKKEDVEQEIENDYEIIHFGDEKVSEACPNNIFEEPNNTRLKNKLQFHRKNFNETQNDGYNYLHSNLLLDDS